MNHASIDRRQYLRIALATGTVWTLPQELFAAENLVAVTFPGTFHDAHRAILVPHFKKGTGADVTLTTQLAVDVISKLAAAGAGKPPFDIAMLDEGPLLDGVKQGLFAEYPVAQSANWKDLHPTFQDKWGPKVTMQAVGIGYNPKRVKNPPRSWDDLWKPEFKGRVGLTALNSSLGVAFLAEIARLRGGGETNIEPAFKALRELLPNVGAISANLGAHATLFQQEQVDIAPHNFNFVENLRSKGVNLEFVVPETGAVGWRTSLHIAKHAANHKLAAQYIESHLVPDVQSEMQKAPYWIIPTNSKVGLAGPVQEKLGKTMADLGKIRFQDWAAINERRGAWIERFNREIRT